MRDDPKIEDAKVSLVDRRDAKYSSFDWLDDAPPGNVVEHVRERGYDVSSLTGLRDAPPGNVEVSSNMCANEDVTSVVRLVCATHIRAMPGWIFDSSRSSSNTCANEGIAGSVPRWEHLHGYALPLHFLRSRKIANSQKTIHKSENKSRLCDF